ncbi:Cyclopropane-fatty-acyl-phospholipid synthase [Vibrio aerogenes CECT 7868]|uniref:Cyclopropane-fatty-acyl-phospholipid synthase n=1 Tax=Vibrio aerogenes CECT 7868 TaxID=1216006 RepID=A0A1M5VLR5_9VIBR|nr:cyclopropane-fatty-acyl-phospholipid synthase family protein [Vibrio aerogenes]SHH75853.1 Cyclopropane-fatty-acyl-phospholipid synthase [Vibrio aerogenes CECT 7868]
MTETLLPGKAKAVSGMDSGAKAILFRCLEQIQTGALIIEESFAPAGHTHQYVFGDAHNQPLQAHICVDHPGLYKRILKGGSIAAAEAYIDGWWEADDLTKVMHLMAQNLNALDAFEDQSSWWVTRLYKLAHWLKNNSVHRARKNIHAHYDLGNEMYRLFLDEKMLYSSGIFRHDNTSLEEAQEHKMGRLCEQLQLKASDHVLEIGTGWGAMAVYMAKHYGCRVTTTTISDAQYDYAKSAVKAAGVEEQVTLLKQDYRCLEGQFDKLVSIEMIEAVGKAYLPVFIQQCHSLIKPGGLMALQMITIADQRLDYYARNVDFIQKYVFPGGFLPSVTALLTQMTRHSRMVVRDIKDIGLDYATTLNHWRERFESRLEEVRALGYDESFIRMWRYYLCYCEGGFLSRGISTVQMTFEKQQ